MLSIYLLFLIDMPIGIVLSSCYKLYCIDSNVRNFGHCFDYILRDILKTKQFVTQVAVMLIWQEVTMAP